MEQGLKSNSKTILVVDDHPRAVASVVAPTAGGPPPKTLVRLEHEYSLAAELEPAWEAKPLALPRQAGRTVLIIADPTVVSWTSLFSGTGGGPSTRPDFYESRLAGDGAARTRCRLVANSASAKSL
jgi:hypothetical protein